MPRPVNARWSRHRQGGRRRRSSTILELHHIPRAAARAGPRTRVGRLMGTVVVVVTAAAVYDIVRPTARGGPRQ